MSSIACYHCGSALATKEQCDCRGALRAIIATLTAERDALKVDIGYAVAATAPWIAQSARLATQVAVLREALMRCEDVGYETNVCRDAMRALSATPADFDRIVDVAKAAVKARKADAEWSDDGIIDVDKLNESSVADDAMYAAVDALTPKAREMLR